MRPLVVATLIALGALAPAAHACGTRAPEVQARLDAETREQLRALAAETAAQADLVFVGTVTALTRPVMASGTPGHVTLAVADTLKGEEMPTHSFAWDEHFVYSCDATKMFHNVGFRDGGAFIVYVREGKLLRVGAADELASSLLPSEEERGLVAGSASK